MKLEVPEWLEPIAVAMHVSERRTETWYIATLEGYADTKISRVCHIYLLFRRWFMYARAHFFIAAFHCLFLQNPDILFNKPARRRFYKIYTIFGYG